MSRSSGSASGLGETAASFADERCRAGLGRSRADVAGPRRARPGGLFSPGGARGGGWGGLPETTAFVAGRWPPRLGRGDAELGFRGSLLPLFFYVERYPAGDTAASHERASPQLVALARELMASGEHRCLAT